MRQVAQQFAVRFGESDLPLFAIDFQLLLDLRYFEHEWHVIARLRSGDDAHRQRIPPYPTQLHDLFALAERIGLRIGDQLLHLAIVAQHAAGELTYQRLARGVEQQLCRLIDMRDASAAADKQHRGGKQIKAVVVRPMRK